jgi:hypothetical protein
LLKYSWSGRDVFSFSLSRSLTNFLFSSSTEKKIKVMTYLMQSAAEDEASEEKGVVVLLMMSNASVAESSIDGNSNVRFQGLIRVLQFAPVRVCAFHVCSPDLREFHIITADLVDCLRRNERLRTRFHYGKN